MTPDGAKMLTNVFRIGGLHQVSWFQLFPDAERLSPTASSGNDRDPPDMAIVAIMMSHMRLQEEGHLSCWTASSRESNLGRTFSTDDKIKLWVFLPGMHDSVGASVHPLINGLKVVGAGLWSSLGLNEEVGAAFCEALRNRLERSLRDLSYVRFGDVFVKCRRHGTLESRKVLLTCEPMFMGSEDAIYIHVIIRRKRVRLLVPSDLQSTSPHRSYEAPSVERCPTVYVAPYGSSGRLTGCCPGDLVTRLSRSWFKNSMAVTLGQGEGLQILGWLDLQADTTSAANAGAVAAQGRADPSGAVMSRAGNGVSSQGNMDAVMDQARDADDGGQAKLADGARLDGKILIYPMEAVLVPILPAVPAHTYLRRCWLQEWAGTHWLEESTISGLHWSSRNYGLRSDLRRITVGTNAADEQNSSCSTSSSSSGSGGSSIKSSSSRGSSSITSGSSGSSESDIEIGESEFEADGDSLAGKGPGLGGGNSSKRSGAGNMQNATQSVDSNVGSLGTKRNRGKATGLSGESPNKMAKISTGASGDMSGFLEGTGASSRKGAGNAADVNALGPLSIGASTPRGSSSQVVTPWDWADDGIGLGLGMGMDMQTDADILAEFGDFGDFFEDDGLHFGEPPGTAESQALMFDFGDGVNTPGPMSMDGTDSMMLPILDFPTLESFGKQPGSSNMEQSVKGIKSETPQHHGSGQFSPQVATPAAAVDLLSKAEAMMLFAPGYARVELPSVKEEAGFSSTYVSESRNTSLERPLKDRYVYSATPPPSTKLENIDSRLERIVERLSRENVESNYISETAGDHKSLPKPTSSIPLNVIDSFDGDNVATSKIRGASHQTGPDVRVGSNGPPLQKSRFSPIVPEGSGKSVFGKFDPKIFPSSKSASPVLATELDCAMVQVSMLYAKGSISASSGCAQTTVSPSSGCIISPPGISRDDGSVVQLDNPGRASMKPPQAQRRKSLPSRIAGDIDEDVQDGLRGAQVGVWRPVQAPKPQKTGTFSMESKTGSSSASPDAGNIGVEAVPIMGSLKPSNWQSLLETIPLLAQQAASAYDVALDGECSDGALNWLAFRERENLQNACGPAMSHSGCGGVFSLRHCLDNAGVEYMDPLAAEISPATVANLLFSDFRNGISAAFGEINVDGPLTAPDWCRYRVQGESTGAGASDSKEGTSTVTSVGGEPVTSSLGATGSMGGLKSAVGMDDLDQRRNSTGWNKESSALSDQTRSNDTGTSDLNGQSSISNYAATTVVLPTPALLVGYQDDWLKTSPNVLHMWEKAPLEPYAQPKPVSYHVLCLGVDALVSAASDFFQQLSSVYEACKLGTHVPGTTAGLGGLNTSKQPAPGLVILEGQPQPGSSFGFLGDFMASMDDSWHIDDFRKDLLRACKSLPMSSSPSNLQRDPEQSQCMVVYIISPSSEPADVLQIVLDVSQCLGTILSEKEKKPVTHSQSVGAAGEDGIIPVVGFSTARVVLQVLPAELVMKGGGVVASHLDMLKEISFCVYSKARRIQRKVTIPDGTLPVLQSSRVRPGVLQSSATMPGMWKDCNTGRNSTVNAVLDASSHRNSWDGGWQPTSRFGEPSLADGGALGSELHGLQEACRYMYEPLFILADPGFPDASANHLSSRTAGKDGFRPLPDDTIGCNAGLPLLGLSDSTSSTAPDNSGTEITGAGRSIPADLHCCYTWTDDLQWLISVWTDARGELLDIHVLPLCGAQKDTAFQTVFSQVLRQGLQLLLMAAEAGNQHPRNIIISRLGGFTERECQEWYRTIMAVGGDESRKWPAQLWPSVPSGTPLAQTQDMSLFADRTVGFSSSGRPPSQSISSSFTSRSKSTGMAMNFARRQGQGLGGSQLPMEPKGAFQWVNSISLISVRVEHSLQAVSVSDLPTSGPGQGGSSSSSWASSSLGNSNNTATGVMTVKTLANMGASYMLVPNTSLRILSHQAWQLPKMVPLGTPTQLAQLVHGSPIAPPLASAFIVSPPQSEFVPQAARKEWPSTLHVGLIALCGNFSGPEISSSGSSKMPKDLVKDGFLEAHRTIQLIAAQVHALSWLTVSPTTLLRHSPLPFHCNVAQRMCRLLSYLDAGHTPSL